ncbi:MAG TPA: hypothetical protein VGK67_41230 [Myxococcales bacterium]
MTAKAVRTVFLACASLGLAAFTSCRTAPGPMDSLLTQHSQALGQARDLVPGLDLQCSPAEAEVAVDGVLQGSCADVEGRMLPLAGDGDHRIEVKQAGFRPYAVELAAGNARTRLKVELVPSG